MVWTSIVASLSFATFAADDNPQLTTEESLQLIAEKCSECHGRDGVAEADIDLLRYTTEAEIRDAREVWLNVNRVLEIGEMPPPDAAQPSDQERHALRAWIESVLLDLAPGELPEPGRAVMRRLTRLEYNNTVRDLFGLDDDIFEFPERLPLRKDYLVPSAGTMPATLTVATYDYGVKRPTLLGLAGLPGDNPADHGFNNRGDVMNVSPMLFERYLQLAKSIVEHPRLPEQSAVAQRLMTEPQLLSVSHLLALLPLWLGLYWATVSLRVRRWFLPSGVFLTLLLVLRGWRFPEWSGDLEFLGWGLLTVGAALGAFANDSRETQCGTSTTSEWRPTLVKLGAALVGVGLICATRGLELALVTTGVVVVALATWCQRLKVAALFGIAAATVAVVITQARGGYDTAAIRPLLGRFRRMAIDDPTDFAGRYPAATLALIAGSVLVVLALFLSIRRSRRFLRPTWCGFLLALTGAALLADDSPQRMLPFVDQRIVSEVRAREVLCGKLQTWLEQATRHSAGPDTVELYAQVYDRGVSQGLGYRECVQSVMAAVLCSPEFLFRVEEGSTSNPGARPLSGDELASRLSYFLWSSMPDAELREAALAGRLGSDEELDHQVQRMLRDPRARELSENFAVQWLHLAQVFTARPDEEVFPAYYAEGEGDSTTTAGLSMLIEPVLLFETVMLEDRSILDFITADYTYLNSRLAAIYGYESLVGGQSPAADEAEWRRVQLPDRRRGGMITMAAPLLITSFPLRTSPVRRGAWVLEVLYNRPPQEPKMAAELKPGAEDDKSMTVRQRFEEHRTDPACATCHRRIDPPGFALECFDVIGAWRTHDGQQPVDTRAKLMDGSTFNGPAEFKARVVEQPRDYVRGFVEHLLSFALGRQLGISDAHEVNRIVDASAVNNYRFSTVIRETVKSRAFRFVSQQTSGAVE